MARKKYHNGGIRVPSAMDLFMDYRTIFDLAESIMVFIDDRQQVAMVNAKCCETLGYTESEIVGKNWFDICLPKEERNKVKEAYRSIMRGDLSPYSHFENHIVTREGERKLISWRNTYLEDTSGNIRYTFSVGEDVTEYLKLRYECERSEKKYRKLFDMQSNCVLLVDRKGVILDANKTICKRFQYTKSSILKLDLAGVLSSEKKQKLKMMINGGFSKGKMQFTTDPININGHLMKFKVRGNVVDRPSGLMLIVLAPVSISERGVLSLKQRIDSLRKENLKLRKELARCKKRKS